MCAITFYIGKDDSLGTTDVGITQAVVMRLVDPIKGRGHHVYMDNYYTSPQLFRSMKMQQWQSRDVAGVFLVVGRQ